jgi:serine phosphatase RsbU (regulator of sigma subunit)
MVVTKFLLLSLTLTIVVGARCAAENHEALLLSVQSLSEGKIRLGPDRGEKTSPSWKYQPGDDLRWAHPAFDDAAWPSTEILFSESPEQQWQGMGWFRLSVRVDSSLWNWPLGATLDQRGASELYLNGRKLFALGRLPTQDNEIEALRDRNPRIIVLDALPDQLIAIRYANTSAGNSTAERGTPEFSLTLDQADRSIVDRLNWIVKFKSHQRFFLGALTVFAILHLLLYLFNRTTRHNLDFAVFAAALAFMVFVNFQLKLTADLADYKTLERLWRVIIMVVAVLGMRTIYHLFYDTLPLQYRILSAAAAFVALASWFNTELLNYVYALALLVTLELLRVIVATTVTRSQPKMWIITAGTTAFLLTIPYQLLMNMRVVGRPVDGLEFVYLYGILAFLISVSGYLSYDFAQMSRKTIEQERRAIEERAERQLLEADNARKTGELEEARRLQLSMLPQSVPDFPQLEIGWYMETASEVGGDYYDYSLSPDNTLTITLGDATGHGLQSGTVVTASKSLFQSLGDHPDIVETFNIISRSLKGMKLERMGMAMTMLKFKDGQVRISAAGMPPMLLYLSSAGTINEVILEGSPLGLPTRFDYQQIHLGLDPGDIILLMSDGLPERLNKENKKFGYPRSAELFQQLVHEPPMVICEEMARGGDTWADGKPQDDDVSFVVLKVR